jgi:hypothetical protein
VKSQTLPTIAKFFEVQKLADDARISTALPNHPHDWAERNPYAATKHLRVAKAKKASLARWGCHENAPSMPQAQKKHANGMPQSDSSNALHDSP